MKFTFRYRVMPGNLLLLAVVNVYRSLAGVVNIVFTLSMVLVAVRFWREVNVPLRVLIVAKMLLFPIFQPLIIYLRSRRIVARMPENLEMTIDDAGISVSAAEQRSLVPYAEIKSVTKVRNILVIYTRSKQGFILNDRTLNGQGPELFRFLSRKLGKNRKK